MIERLFDVRLRIVVIAIDALLVLMEFDGLMHESSSGVTWALVSLGSNVPGR